MRRNTLLKLILPLLLVPLLGCDAPATSSEGPGNDEKRPTTAAKGDTDVRGVRIEGRNADSVSRRYAFLVGVNDYDNYKNDRLYGLSFCENDMQAMEKELREIGFTRVYCLTTGSSFSWQPTKKQIEAKLKRLLAEQKLDADDLVLVALSGHGLERTGPDGKKHAYFCPTDAHSEKTDTMVSIDWIYSQLNQSNAGMKLLLVDACRNLAEPKAVGQESTISPESRGFMKSLADSTPPKGIAAMLSCQSGQFSHEEPKLRRGVFIYHVIEGLSGKADSVAGNRDGWVSISELYNFASDQTENYVNTKCTRKFSDQTPVLRGDLPNYKLVRSSYQPVGPALPDKLKLSFTVKAKSLTGKPLSDATVELLYRGGSNRPEATIGRSQSDASGKCNLSLPGFWSGVQGDFAVLVRKGGCSKRFPLSDFSTNRSWDLYCPTELAKDFTNSIGMKFKLIPAGSFMMGSPEDEKNRENDEGPVHRVRITKPYYLGMYEVTVGQFREFVEATGYKTEGEKDGKGGYGYDGKSASQKPEYTWRNPGFSQDDDHPVTEVSWNDAVAFCKWLSQKEDCEYRLPTEAQWEYACRSGSKAAYSFGANPETLVQVGNVGDSALKAKFPDLTGTIAANDGYVFTAPVGHFRANGYGIYDMHGNVWEWCSDWYGSKYYAESPEDDPTGPTGGSDRVFRGGSWFNFARRCRSASRNGITPDIRYYDLGFRVVLVPSSDNLPDLATNGNSSTPPKKTPKLEKVVVQTMQMDWPFDATEANRRQAATAKIQKIPIEHTNSIGMKFKLIPNGEFMMGSPEDEEGHCSIEKQHKIHIAKPYYIGAYEVTFGDFQKFVEATGYKTDAEKEGWSVDIAQNMTEGFGAIGGAVAGALIGDLAKGLFGVQESEDQRKEREKKEWQKEKQERQKQKEERAKKIAFLNMQSISEEVRESYRNGVSEYVYENINWQSIGYPQTNNHPVVAVSWNDAVAFVKWLSKKEGKVYRLPTEAEWEYACRAGTKTPYYTGNDFEGFAPQPNETFNQEKGVPIYLNRGHKKLAVTIPVGKFKANAFGLYNMHDNAAEWCTSKWHIDNIDTSAITIRGGGIGEGFLEVHSHRSAARVALAPLKKIDGHRSTTLGFRIVLEPSE